MWSRRHYFFTILLSFSARYFATVHSWTLLIYFLIFKCIFGATENAGVEKSARSKIQGWKRREWKHRHDFSGVENAGVDTWGKTVVSVFRIWGTEQGCK